MAHRGWHTGELTGLENTLAAFVRAAAEGYAYVETDAQATADGAVVLHHDATLTRTTGVAAPVVQLSLPEVRRALVGGQEPVPTLDEVLRALPHTRFNIDLKTDAVVDPLLRLLNVHEAWDRVCLASFSDSRLARVRRLTRGRVLTSLGPASVGALRVRSLLPVGLPARGPPSGQLVQVPAGARWLPLVDHRFLAQAHRSGREVHVWTVDSPTRMHALLELGVDGIITDAPEVLREVLDTRGRWLAAR